MPEDSTKRFGMDMARLVYQGVNGFMKVWRIRDRNWEIVEKKDAVAILVYHRNRQQIILVNQYRPASVVGSGKILETPAGHLEGSVEPSQIRQWVLDTMVREVQEEIGANISPNAIELVSETGLMTSPGFTTEKLWLGYVEIGDADIEQTERIFGLEEEGERIERAWLNVNDLGLLSSLISDMKTFALIQWFLLHKRPQLT